MEQDWLNEITYIYLCLVGRWMGVLCPDVVTSDT